MQTKLFALGLLLFAGYQSYRCGQFMLTFQEMEAIFDDGELTSTEALYRIGDVLDEALKI